MESGLGVTVACAMTLRKFFGALFQSVGSLIRPSQNSKNEAEPRRRSRQTSCNVFGGSKHTLESTTYDEPALLGIDWKTERLDVLQTCDTELGPWRT